mgnify:CR=1 FL=1
MTGKLKILSLSKDIEGLKEKKVYQDVNIHFRDSHSHTLTLNNTEIRTHVNPISRCKHTFKNKKEYVLEIAATSIEAESLLIEGDIWTDGQEQWRAGTIFEFRFWPFCK